MPISFSTRQREVGQHQRRRLAVQPLGAGEVEERLVDRDRLDQRRQRLHHGAHLAADADIFLHVRRDDDRLRAGFERLEHRHGRAHALDAGDVAGGRDDAALAAADDHRLVLQRRDCRAFRPPHRRRRSRYGRDAAGRAPDGGPAAGCRSARSARAAPRCSVRQSRQKPCSGSLTGAAIAANIKRTTQMVFQRADAATRRRPGERLS